MGKEKGFTILELMLLVALSGLAAALVIFRLNNAIETVHQKRSINDLKQWEVALQTYNADYGFYPFNPIGPNAPVGPGVFIYDMFRYQKYLQKDLYLDGWEYKFVYTAGGTDMFTAQGYTIASLGKGHQADTALPSFKCFQCDIRMSNGEFFAKPEGQQLDSGDGLTCPSAQPCMPVSYEANYTRGKQ
jgi:type II secretory pathway pseudopilin PulG